MASQWRRGCLVSLLACCMVLGTIGAITFAGIRTNRFYLAPPAELLDLGPIWIGDFCRDNVAHGRYPPGWCPPDYTVYFIFRVDNRGSIIPIVRIPETIAKPRERR